MSSAKQQSATRKAMRIETGMQNENRHGGHKRKSNYTKPTVRQKIKKFFKKLFSSKKQKK